MNPKRMENESTHDWQMRQMRALKDAAAVNMAIAIAAVVLSLATVIIGLWTLFGK